MDNLTVYEGHGRLESANSVRVNGDLLEAEQIILNVRGRAMVPDMPGIDDVEFMTNTGIMNVDFLPEHLGDRRRQWSGRETLVGKMKMARVGRARERGEIQGFMKVLIDAETERFLGATILGIGGDELRGLGAAGLTGRLARLAGDKIYVTFDRDFIDQADAPGTGSPAPAARNRPDRPAARRWPASPLSRASTSSAAT